MTMKLADLVSARPRPGPRYRAIADAIAEAMETGALAPGERLPPMRDLAWRLNVTTGTVARAYALAASRGHVGGEIGRGTFIRERTAQGSWSGVGSIGFSAVADNIRIQMKANLPADIGQSDVLAEEMNALSREIASAAQKPAFGYMPAGGGGDHRAAGAAWLSIGSFAVAPDEVVVCSGAQQAIFAAILAATEPGDTILTEALTYHAITAQALMMGRRVAPVDIDEEGLIPEALARACEEHRPRALFTMPTLHNPTTAIMSTARRERIAEIARAHRLAVIEDDIYANLLDADTSEARPLPLAYHLPELTYYVNSLSKAIAPGLRIAYLKPPRDRLDRTRAIAHGLGQTVPPLMADLATRIVGNGKAAAIVARQRVEIAARNELAATYLTGAAWRSHPAAMHLWLHLSEGWRAHAFADAVRARGVLVGAGEDFMVGRPDRASRHIRLCLGQPATRADVEQGLAVVAELLDEVPIEMSTLA